MLELSLRGLLSQFRRVYLDHSYIVLLLKYMYLLLLGRGLTVYTLYPIGGIPFDIKDTMASKGAFDKSPRRAIVTSDTGTI